MYVGFRLEPRAEATAASSVRRENSKSYATFRYSGQMCAASGTRSTAELTLCQDVPLQTRMRARDQVQVLDRSRRRRALASVQGRRVRGEMIW